MLHNATKIKNAKLARFDHYDETIQKWVTRSIIAHTFDAQVIADTPTIAALSLYGWRYFSPVRNVRIEPAFEAAPCE